jgi:4-cresol dehydrogenase (hydroxylating) cytochrome subunit
MRRYKVGLPLVLAIIGAGACLAQSVSQPRDPSHVYAATCQYCHDTGIGPPLKGAHFPADRIRLAVRHGPGSMPAFMPSDITEPELDALARMLSELSPPVAGRETRP